MAIYLQEASYNLQFQLSSKVMSYNVDKTLMTQLQLVLVYNLITLINYF